MGAVIVDAFIPGEPVSKARPRFNPKTGRVYTPAATHIAELTFREAVQGLYPDLKASARYGFVVEVEFHVKHGRRRDVDNLAKTVLDALNNAVWADDAQVVELHCTVTRVTEDPGTHLRIRRVAAHAWS